MESHQVEGVPEALPVIKAEVLTVIPFTVECVAVGREGGDLVDRDDCSYANRRGRGGLAIGRGAGGISPFV